MPRTTAKKQAKSTVVTKTAAVDPAKLMNLLNDADFIEDEERSFWSANFENLAAPDQKALTAVLTTANQELTQENDHHIARCAEINAKLAGALRQIAERNKSALQAEVAQAQQVRNTADDDLLDDELLAQLEQYGEV
jgi:hypothetical protein